MSIIIHDLHEAKEALILGEVVAIPTETVYGLAARADNAMSIRHVFEIKKRPLNHPLILHIAHPDMIYNYVTDVTASAKALIETFWPGPLTLVMQANPKNVLPEVTGGQNTVAIRCPNHPLTQSLLKLLQFPLVAPSANPYKHISPTTAEHVHSSFPDESIKILDGGRCFLGLESTILDVTDPRGFRLLRQGAIPLSQLEEVAVCLDDASILPAPGRCKEHYQPTKPLLFAEKWDDIEAFISENKGRFTLLRFNDSTSLLPIFFQFDRDPKNVAYEWYYQLRKADKTESDGILIDLPEDKPEWSAIRERIFKAGKPLMG